MAKALGRLQTKPERAQPRLVEDVQRVQPWVNRLGALEVQHRGEHTVAQAGVQLIGRAHDLDLALGLRFELKQARGQRHRLALRIAEVERLAAVPAG